MSETVEMRNGTDEYLEQVVPSDVREVFARLEAIDNEIMRGAVADRFAPKLRLQQILLEATALHSYFAHRYFRWKAILDNREVEAYIALKNETVARGEKFVSASAEREAATKVLPVRYLANFYQGNMERAIGYMNSLKKLLETIEDETKGAA